MRGERIRRRYRLPKRVGSSPHARGTLMVHAVHLGQIRFIPACVGNAMSPIFFAGTYTVHPRMRGERMGEKSINSDMAGSSPHARGTPVSRCADDHQCRFIPACAGNASWSSPCPRRRSVHPRMRGERSVYPNLPARPTGSSPHARGTHIVAAWIGDNGRFIPACAGNAWAGQYPACRGTVHPRMRGERTYRTTKGNSYFGSSPHARGTRDTTA